MTSSSTFSSRWTNSRARSSAMLDRSRSSSIGPLAPGEGGGQTATYYAHFPVSWQPVKAGGFQPRIFEVIRVNHTLHERAWERRPGPGGPCGQTHDWLTTSGE